MSKHQTINLLNICHRKARNSSTSNLSAEDDENEDEFKKSSRKNGLNKPNTAIIVAAKKYGNNVRQKKAQR